MNPDTLIDSFRSYELAIAALREMRVRDGTYPPRNEQERRWAAEGPVRVNMLEAARG